jgi:hypothetical protein
VSADSPSTATVNTGAVQFVVDSVNFGGPVPVNNSGLATSSTTMTLTGGPHTITATYTGGTNFNNSIASLTQTVNQSATSMTLTSSMDPSVFGQTITFTATVTPNSGSGTPTGTVVFQDGTATLGTASLSSGQASFSTSSLAAGNHSISASYVGDANFTGSASAVLVETVNKDGTTTILTSSPNPSLTGQSITFAATVTANAPGTGTATGMVTFTNLKGTLATITLDNTGHASFVTSLPKGTTTVTAVYNGDGNFLTSSGTTVQTVNSNKKTTAVGFSLASANVAGPVNVVISALPPIPTIPSGSMAHDTKEAWSSTQVDRNVETPTRIWIWPSQNNAIAPVVRTIQERELDRTSVDRLFLALDGTGEKLHNGLLP